MAINLTEGAIEMLCSKDPQQQASDEKPVLQVADIRLVNTQQQQQQQHNPNERYRLLLSDGSFLQQGMLATQRNDLVKSGRLQKGSVVQLTQFVCNLIQQRMIIIIIDLEVILEKCDPIGEPKQYVPGSSAGGPSPHARPLSVQPSTAAAPGNSQTSVGTMPINGANVRGGAPSLQPRANSGAEPYSASLSKYMKMESGARAPGSYNDQDGGFRNPRPEVSQPPFSSYARPPQPAYQQPPPMYMNKGPMAKNEAAPRIVPIAALNPYQGRWTIKARVTAKTDLKHYSNARGEGQVFSFDLLDADGGEIRVTSFNAVADQFYSQVELGKVYLISRGSLKPARKNFNNLNNEYEITLESSSTIQPCYEDDSVIPRQQFHFRPISDIEGMESNSMVDVIGIVCFISPSSSIMRKDGTEAQKRTLHLKDPSARSVELTLWGNFCNAEGQTLQSMCDAGNRPVLALKSGRVSEFNGKVLNSISSSQLFIDPDFPEARRLRMWFDSEGCNMSCVSISREMTNLGRTDVRKTISQIKDERLGTSEKPDWITVSATISFIKGDNFCYTACPITIGDRQCNKKVTNNGDGKWRCDRCDQFVDECDYRYILQFQIQDHTGLTWVTSFQECGEDIMGISAKDLYFMKYEEQDDEKFAQVIRQVIFSKYIFKLKVKEETFSDEQRVKSTVVKAEKIDFSSESRFLLNLVENAKGVDLSSNAPKAESGVSTPGMNLGFGNAGVRQSVPPEVNYIGSSINASRDAGLSGNQVSQYGNQYTNTRVPQAIGNSFSCNSCGSTGHSAANCPSVMSGPGLTSARGYADGPFPGSGSGGSSGECYKCHQSGHWARDCPGLATATPAYGSNTGGGSSNECYKCHQSGHWAKDCPGLGTGAAAYGSNTAGGSAGDCYKCHQSGHWAKDCPGLGTGPPAYGSNTPGRYGGISKQRIGGF